MTGSATRAPGGEPDVDALLPGYVTGRLDARDAQAVDAWIAADPGPRRERVAFERAIAQDIERRVQELPADIGLDRLIRAAAADRSPQAAARPGDAGSRAQAAARPSEHASSSSTPGFGERLRRWFAGPQLGWALAAVVVVQSGVIVSQVGTPAGGPVEYRSAGPVDVRPAVRIAVAADASEAALRRALLEAGATLVAGPSQLGDYWVRPIAGELDALATRLRAMPAVQSADVDPAGPPPLR